MHEEVQGRDSEPQLDLLERHKIWAMTLGVTFRAGFAGLSHRVGGSGNEAVMRQSYECN